MAIATRTPIRMVPSNTSDGAPATSKMVDGGYATSVNVTPLGGSTRNLSDLDPSPLVFGMFASHPTGPQRIALARTWERVRAAAP